MHYDAFCFVSFRKVPWTNKGDMDNMKTAFLTSFLQTYLTYSGWNER